MNSARKIAIFIGWLLTIAALFYLIYRLCTYNDYDAFWDSFTQANTKQTLALIAAFALLPCQLLVEARKWQTMLVGLVHITLNNAWWQVIYGNIAAFITPYRLGEYPARLLQMGYSLSQWRDFIGSWKDWIKDWKKWIHVLALHLLRYFIWGMQLWAILFFCGITLKPLEALCAIAIYYALITIMPSVPAADVAIKGGWSVVIFAQFTDNIPAIAVSVTLIWIINTVIPILIGAVFRAKK